ncbi:small acid-soluble spore protein SspI [Paenibacillus lignilyticus]|uniref:Small, acid-soluble spore protein I n=1 Tax=Paenibacillus lignilyticus TaxID=1172615 RepID=A0ABS5CJ82_9BACL|nr:small acid-soluble spore protein SspI [Paenibacillus lignilyticus]MBP3965911.1 small acid-soluble spore protein SspI [Paenibacillus lignilyticus]
MNNLDLRQAIVRRVQNLTGEELTDVIEGSIGSDEKALPGLGVLFEMIWKNSEESDHNRMVQALYDVLHPAAESASPSPS